MDYMNLPEVPEKIYLNIPFPQKDVAKALGARWDFIQKSWYTTNALEDASFKTALLKQFSITVPLVLNGEDRTFGKDTLTIELVPTVCLKPDFADILSRDDLIRLKRTVFTRGSHAPLGSADSPQFPQHVAKGRANQTCELCKEKAPSPQLLPRYAYVQNEGGKCVQTLVRLLCVCTNCLTVTHFDKIGPSDVCYRRLVCLFFQTVRNLTKEECAQEIAQAYTIWNERNAHVWELDLSLLTNNGINLIMKPMSGEERKKASDAFRYTKKRQRRR